MFKKSYKNGIISILEKNNGQWMGGPGEGNKECKNLSHGPPTGKRVRLRHKLVWFQKFTYYKELFDAGK